MRARRKTQLDAVFRVATNQRMVALTFDDGPDPDYTPHVLRDLRRRGHHPLEDQPAGVTKCHPREDRSGINAATAVTVWLRSPPPS